MWPYLLCSIIRIVSLIFTYFFIINFPEWSIKVSSESVELESQYFQPWWTPIMIITFQFLCNLHTRLLRNEVLVLKIEFIWNNNRLPPEENSGPIFSKLFMIINSLLKCITNVFEKEIFISIWQFTSRIKFSWKIMVNILTTNPWK